MMWGVTTFFNPLGFRTKLDNYRKFRAWSHAQGLPLVAVELATETSDFVLESGRDAEIVVRRRSSTVLWHKERLLSIGIDHVPAECREICWTDADVIIDAMDWVERAIAELERYPVIQPFQRALRLARDMSPPSEPTPLQIVDDASNEVSFCAMTRDRIETTTFHTGYIWCARRVVLEGIGLFDRCIIGGGDRVMALAFAHPCGLVPNDLVYIRHRPLHAASQAWHEQAFERVGGRLSYLPYRLLHLWHGDVEDRQYWARHEILKRHDFCPETDISIGPNGCWEWSTDKAALVDEVRRYFECRKEDG